MTMNTHSLDELIRILKATRMDLQYADDPEDSHYALHTMASDIDAALSDLVESYGGDGSAFRGANSVAMEISLSEVDIESLFDDSGEVAMLDSEFDDWN
jgi:hypothetical protein